MEALNIVVLDFEFTMVHRTSILLVSGAMVNIHKEAKVMKLRGPPLILGKENNEVQQLQKTDINFAIKNIMFNFRNNEELLNSMLNELNYSYITKISTLKYSFIYSYLNCQNKKPIIVTWNGTKDKEILKRFNIAGTILSLSCYDNLNDNVFFLKIINLNTKQILAETKLGNFDKNGRLLNLNETHDLILCNENHNDTYLHDPVTDVKITRCLYHYLNNKSRISLENV